MDVELELFGPGARFHHVGMAVRSIAEACPACQSVADPVQRVRVGFARIGGLAVELIEPAGEASPIDQSLANNVKLLHICVEVPNLEAALAESRRNGFHRVSPPAPAEAFGGRQIVWVYSNMFGLFELLERGEP